MSPAMSSSLDFDPRYDVPALSAAVDRGLGSRDADGYASISDYAFLSDCRSAALVSSDGAVDWLCWPRFDSPAVFAAILDAREGGAWSIRPLEPYTSTRRYLPHTNVVETTFTPPRGRCG